MPGSAFHLRSRRNDRLEQDDFRPGRLEHDVVRKPLTLFGIMLWFSIATRSYCSGRAVRSPSAAG
ncbi:hypothetical protein E0H33_09905 [Rhizobium leguminosarum bv. viciae]|nr:hypothetical protein E0H33_09905 [Rhizobium leguminosarum bv. viciae]